MVVVAEGRQTVYRLARGIKPRERDWGKVVVMAHVFISYAHADKAFAEELKRQIESAGFKHWIDSEQLRGGEDWRQEIDDGIRKSFVLVVIMTSYAKKSDYVTYEWGFAWGTGVKVVPILLKPLTTQYFFKLFKKTWKLHPRLEASQYIDISSGDKWGQLIDLLNRMKKDEWIKMWIPRTASQEIQSALEFLMTSNDPDKLCAYAKIIEKEEGQKQFSVLSLIEALNHEDSIIRAKAAWVLGPLRDTRSVSPLIIALKDDDPAVRAHAAGALGHIRDHSAIDELVKLLSDEHTYASLEYKPSENDTVSKRARKALMEMDQSTAVEQWQREQDGGQA